LYQALVTANHPIFLNLFIGLMFMGLTIGTPINYLMMSLVPPEEAAAQSTVSLLLFVNYTNKSIILSLFINYLCYNKVYFYSINNSLNIKYSKWQKGQNMNKSKLLNNTYIKIIFGILIGIISQAREVVG